ncbi:WD_REPEATS_REGION domain-containing protein, partial [Haematococcus lacustris]
MIGVWEAYGHTERVFDVRFQPSTSDLFASASEDCTVRVWRDVGARRYKQVLCCKSHESEVLRLGWSGDGSMLASGAAVDTLAAPGLCHHCLNQGCKAAQYSAQPLANLSAQLSLRHISNAASSLLPTVQAQLIAQCECGRPQNRVNPPHTAAVASGYQHAYIFSCAVQPAGGGGGGGGGGSHRLVAAGCSDGQLRLWALCPLGAGRGPALITATLFSADGGQLAVVTRDGSVAVMAQAAGGVQGSSRLPAAQPLRCCCWQARTGWCAATPGTAQ